MRARRELTVEGVTKSLIEWSELSGIRNRTIAFRIDSGWEPKRAITERAVQGNNQRLRTA